MFPSIDLISLILSLVTGALAGLLVGTGLHRINFWLAAIVSLISLLLAPFIGHGTWLVGSGDPITGELSGIHLQYFFAASAVTIALLTSVRLLRSKSPIAKAA
ncbi:MAG: hypothetical protein IPH75_07205 [bacterium]|nr:hypothetical protein [bacterium]